MYDGANILRKCHSYNLTVSTTGERGELRIPSKLNCIPCEEKKKKLMAMTKGTVVLWVLYAAGIFHWVLCRADKFSHIS